MPIANFHIVACPRGEADQDDLDETSPTGFRLTPEQQDQLDRATRLLEREAQLLGVVTAVVMGVPVKTDYAIELLDYIGKGIVEVSE